MTWIEDNGWTTIKHWIDGRAVSTEKLEAELRSALSHCHPYPTEAEREVATQAAKVPALEAKIADLRVLLADTLERSVNHRVELEGASALRALAEAEASELEAERNRLESEVTRLRYWRGVDKNALFALRYGKSNRDLKLEAKLKATEEEAERLADDLDRTKNALRVTQLDRDEAVRELLALRKAVVDVMLAVDKVV